jgi:hypothetical protein
MTTLNGQIDFEYKEGTTDSVGVALDQNGKYVNLTGCTVVLVIKDNANHRFSVPCSLGGTVKEQDENGDLKDVYHAPDAGGCTIKFNSTHLATKGEYNCEFVVTNADGEKSIIPNGNEYFVLKIYPAL